MAVVAVDNKKLIEHSIFTVVALGLIALGVYAFQQFNKLKNVCYFITGGIINTINTEEIDVTILLGIKNISAISITINSADIQVYVNGQYITSITKTIAQTVTSQSLTTVDLDVNFNPNTLLKSGSALLSSIINTNGEIVIGVQGTVSISSGAISVNDLTFSDQVTLQQIQAGGGSGTKC